MLPRLVYSPLFSRPAELGFLLLPAPFLVLAALEVALAWSFMTSTRGYAVLLANLLFFVSHNAFSYILLLLFPELRAWSRNSGLLLPFYAGLALLFAVFFYLFHHLPPLPFKVFLFAGLALSFHHQLMQVQGFSLQYLQRFGLRSRAWEKAEKILFHLLVAAVVLLVWARLEGNASLFDPPAALFIGALSAAVALSGGLVLLSLRTAGAGVNRSLFLLRLGLFPAVPFSLFASLGTMVSHGAEYGLLFRQMSGNSEFSRSARSKAAAAAIVLLVCLLVLFRSHGGLPAAVPEEGWARAAWSGLGALSFALTFGHYYLDRALFRMQHAPTRAAVGPLLSPAPGKNRY